MWLDRSTAVRYYQDWMDVTWYVMNNIPVPLSENFFPVRVVVVC
jgi:hypothetical protein